MNKIIESFIAVIAMAFLIALILGVSWIAINFLIGITGMVFLFLICLVIVILFIKLLIAINDNIKLYFKKKL